MSNAAQLVVGDKSDHGGTIITGDSLMTLNSKPCARIGDLHSCPLFYPTVPPIPHGITPIIKGVNSPCRAIVNGREVALEGDFAGCGCILKSSNPSLSTCLAIGALVLGGLMMAISIFANSRKEVPVLGNITSPNSNNLTDDQLNMINDKVLNYETLYNKIVKPVVQQTPESTPNKNENCNCK